MSRKKPTLPEPPPHLDAVGIQKFQEVCGIIKARGDDLDGGTLDAVAAYASSWSLWVSASRQVAELGQIVRSSTGTPQECPFLTVARKAQVALRQWGMELRLTPRSRKGQSARPAAKSAAPDSDPDQELRLLMLTQGLRHGA